uniref:F-box domain-containing protein n=1 Tax=Fagus sylvatica TaxID=28930 RepID=A0A2N9GDT6_FAGSY
MAQNNNSDKISNLPDSILCHILSFLPTIEAVATSILSSRWTPLWTLVPNLDFDVDELNKTLTSSSSDQCHFSFAQILSRVWALRNVNSVEKFQLKWLLSHCDPIDVDSCVRAVILRGVEQLCLNISHEEPLKLPRSLFICKTLVHLTLRGDIVIHPHSASSLPTLKTLHLEHVKYANDESLCRLLSCCPILQTLHLRTFDIQRRIKIIVPTLKRLHIHISFMNIILEINSPNLEYLYFNGHLSQVVLLENLSKLIEAVVWDDDNGRNRAEDFIRLLNNVKYLHWKRITTECRINTYIIHPPMFHNLARLNFQGCCCYWLVLQSMFERAPNLEEIVFEPSDELELVRDILENARFLKKLTITSNLKDLEENSVLLRELLCFPRLSRKCKIAIVN